MAVRKKKSASEVEDQQSESLTKQNVYLIHGDDDYLVAQEARKILAALQPKGATMAPGENFNVEMIEGDANNQGEAAAVFGRLFEALQSQSFFATDKVIWWRDTNLLGSSQTASAAAVADFIQTLDKALKAGIAGRGVLSGDG
jgi:DNA polymerase III delta subunit